MRALATIRQIGKIEPIEGADKIKLAHVDGWQCVIGAEDFKDGDFGMFFEIDSALDPNDGRYSFLKERCYREWKDNSGSVVDACIRIKTCKFRGVLSQGLLMPLDRFPECLPGVWEKQKDFTELLRVRLYDDVKEAAEIKTGRAKIAGEAKGNFPVHLFPKTDEPRLQNLPDYFESMKDVAFECTEKFDGSSTTMFYAGKSRPECPFGVCSRNLELKPSEDNIFWKMARKYDIENKLRGIFEDSGNELAIQGETVGPGVNGNRDSYTDAEFFVFRIYDITNKRWLTPLQRQQVCEKWLNVPHVKVIRDDWKVFQDLRTIDDFLAFVQGKTDRGHEREGMVWKSIDGTVSFKVINPVYLLKEK